MLLLAPSRLKRLCLLLCLLGQTYARTGAQTCGVDVPPAPREFRAAWVATVANIDWPSSPRLTSEEQKRELIRILDLAKELNLNAIILQVRPQCDALYASRLEPWSEFLTGRMGQPPVPFYDPLAFAVREAHARGLELHAWFNPYRALHPNAQRPPAPGHIAARRPDLAKSYGKYVWLDPGEKEVQDHSLSVVLDVVRRYDVDGVHFDDYFYPYPEKDAAGSNIPFPDEPSWQKYVSAGGRLSREDWRRQNVDEFIRRVAAGVKRLKPHVKFGVSPFGIWQPGHPPGIEGFNAYAQLYADARRWLREGWVDYLTPQLYWPIRQTPQSYTALLDWWLAQNVKGRHVWPGNAAYRVGSTQAFPPGEIIEQVALTRARSRAPGNVFFSMKTFLKNTGGLNELLKAGPYARPALVPELPWLKGAAPAPPLVKLRPMRGASAVEISWRPRRRARHFLTVVQVKEGGTWNALILPASVRSYTYTPKHAGANVTIALSLADRSGRESARTVAPCPRRAG